MERIECDGAIFSRNPSAKNRSDRVYFKGISCLGKEYLHRYIWRKHNGEIPKGHHIHHKDGDPLNNDIENLECISPAQHREHHGETWSDREALLEHLSNMRVEATEWHKSAEGRKWHKEHARILAENEAKKPRVEKQCSICNKSYLCPPAQQLISKYCSNNCKSQSRRSAGKDREERVCVQCQSTFTCNKYFSTQCCSGSCATRKQHADRRREGSAIEPKTS